MFTSMDDAIHYIFATRRRLDAAPRGLDEYTRDAAPTRALLRRVGGLTVPREYAVVTGSRGKGSVTAIMAKLLETLGHTVGAITSPHLRHWNERIRVNGRMIPSGDFLRILSQLQPAIDEICAGLDDARYLSPQGIFLAIALRYFDERAVDMAVLEVGRGGRFDDVAVAPNRLAVFAPIMLEHQSLLGGSLGRIAWHKAGVIKAGGLAVSLPQAPAALAELKKEAHAQGAAFSCLKPDELGQWIADRESSQLIRMPGYGALELPMLGRYQIANASLAIRAVERWTGRSPKERDFAADIRAGLSRARWLGRAQRIAGAPAVFIDGAITRASARSFVESVVSRVRQPVVGIVGVPLDRDYAGVYHEMASLCGALIITETDINPNTRFPARDEALMAARRFFDEPRYAPDLPAALALAREMAGAGGTILLAGSLMLVGECMLIWDIDASQI